MPTYSLRPSNGFSLAELAIVMTLVTVTAAVTMPRVLTAIDDLRALGAVRYLSSALQQARMEAVVRHQDVAIRFVTDGATYAYAMYVDGNGNGVRTREIASGVDIEIRRPERLPDQFAGVDFGAVAGLPPIDSSSVAPGSDPIRLGSGNLVTFSAVGTSTSGSLYVRGRRDIQYALRIFGETGKTRILKFEPRARQWKPL